MDLIGVICVSMDRNEIHRVGKSGDHIRCVVGDAGTTGESISVARFQPGLRGGIDRGILGRAAMEEDLAAISRQVRLIPDFVERAVQPQRSAIMRGIGLVDTPPGPQIMGNIFPALPAVPGLERQRIIGHREERLNAEGV